MAYVTVATGYKAPQLNDGLSATIHDLSPVRAERPINYEAGVKKSLFDHRLYVDADVFYTDVQHFQTQSCVPAVTGIQCSNINVPSVITKGVEWEIFGRPWRNTTVNISGIYNDAAYPNSFLGADLTDLSHQQLNYAPKFKTTISLQQDVPLTDRYVLFFGTDATVRTKQSMYLSSDPKYVVPGQALINLRAGLRAGGSWTLALFARNVTNKIYPVQLYPSDTFAVGGLWQILDPNAQRVVGLQIDASF